MSVDGLEKAEAPAGSVLRRAQGGVVKRVDSGGKRWTAEAEVAFLDELAGSANVRRSARACGFNFATVYKQRAARPDFAEKWQVALAQGAARLEIALIRGAADSMEGLEPDPDSPFPRMSVEQALSILKYHAVATGRNGRAPSSVPRRRTVEELKESLLRKAEAILAAGERAPGVAGAEGVAEGAAE